MALKTTALKRKFIYKGKRLDDIVGISGGEVVKTHAASNPELVNATYEYKGIENGEQIYHISTKTGTKG